MKRIAWLLTVLLLIAGTLIFCTQNLYSGDLFTEKAIPGGSVATTVKLDLWHHSGGYWNVGNADAGKIRVLDDVMRNRGERILADALAKFQVALPDAVQERIDAGANVIAKVSDNGVPLHSLFVAESIQVTISNGMVRLDARPIFNMIERDVGNYNSFGFSVDQDIPLIDRKYGCNIYSMFGNGFTAAQAAGWVNENDLFSPAGIPAGLLHPSYIKDNSGFLKPGYKIYIKGALKDSSGLQVGAGTFAGSGAIGLSFSFPVRFDFFEVIETPAAVTPPAIVSPPAIITPPAIVTSTAVNAVLELPSHTYEGHPVLAGDVSTFDVGGETMAAADAYEQGLARNRFRIEERGAGTIAKQSDTRAQALFPRSGTYSVRLTVDTVSGERGEDIKPIAVLETPVIIHSLSGTQKQNRKQTLNITVAQNPAYPIAVLWAELKESQTGQTVRLYYDVNGGANSLENTDIIKTRAVADNGTTAQFVSVILDFLTKNTQDGDFSYRIFAEDTRGNTDEVFVEFPVAVDNPPIAAVDIAPSFLRGKGSNTAAIVAEDKTVTGGDQVERLWYYKDAQGRTPLKAVAGYRDLSFGSGKQVGFSKTGVGPFHVELFVKDVWTEETLSEYITDSDYLTGSAVAASLVDNVAPVVSLELKPVKTADVLLFAEGEAAAEAARDGAADLSTMLLAEGIDANIRVQELWAPAGSTGGVVSNVGSLRAPYGHQGTWAGFWESGSFTADETGVYKAEATWIPGEDLYETYPEQPYTIKAYRVEDLVPLWSFTISEHMFPVAADNGYNAYFAHDCNDRYLYFIFDSNTFVLDKENGALIALLPYAIGRSNFVTDEYIFTFMNDGIYCISKSDGSMRRIVSESIYTGDGAVSEIGGRLVFMCKRGTELFRGAFDAGSQTVDFVRLQGTASDPGTAVSYLVGTDSAGVMVVNTLYGAYTHIRAFDGKGRLLSQYKLTLTPSRQDCAVPVYDKAGRINYVGIRNSGGNSKRKWVSVSIYGLYNGYVDSLSAENSTGYPTEVDRVLFGLEKPEGHVYIGLGSEWTYFYNSGYNNGPEHGRPERAAVYGFDVRAGSAAMAALGDVAQGLYATSEYGMYRPGVLLISTGDNHPEPAAANHTTRVLRVSESREDQIQRYKTKYLSYETDYTFSTITGEQFSPEDVADAVTGRVATGENRFVIRTASDGGNVSRSVNLVPGRTYFYEYDTSADHDILNVNAMYERAEDLPSSYVVSEEFYEDFNDDELCTYFSSSSSRLSAGEYNIAMVYLKQSSGSSNKYRADGSEIRFTVPTGSAACLSFDYSMLMDSGWTANFFTIGKVGETQEYWYEHHNGGSPSGHYMHKRLLSPGEYVLTGYCRAYGGRIMNYHTKIDNLRVLLLKPCTDAVFSPVQALPLSSSKSTENDLTHIQGSFTAPNGAVSFSQFRAEYVKAGVNTTYAALSGKAGAYVETVTIPQGKAAIFMATHIWSSPAKSGDRYYDVRFEWGGRTWSCAAANKYPQSACDNIPGSYKLVGKNITGAQVISQSSSTHSNAYGGFSDVELLIATVGAIPASIQNGEYVVENGAIFENVSFDGTANLVLLPGTVGDTVVRNLKLYTVENGARVYVDNTGFREATAPLDWVGTDAVGMVENKRTKKEEARAMVYKKGQYISHVMHYSDYEDDPSLRSYYRYIHTPFNDGPHPLTGQILGAPIRRFYVDGRYVLQHWQTDDASREGGSPYDKDSNVCELIFFIEGAAEAPWVTHIRTRPANVDVGDDYAVLVGVDDKEKDVLTLTTEVYHESNTARPIYTHVDAGLTTDYGGRYPEVVIQLPEPAIPGTYDVVAVVRDESGAGLGSYRFTCELDKSLTGSVDHTDGWEKNRRSYNLQRFGIMDDRSFGDVFDFEEYAGRTPPRPRPPKSVFWPGEALILTAEAGGEPTSVTCSMPSYPEFSCKLSLTDHLPDGTEIYTAAFWHKDMEADMGRDNPKPVILRFRADYVDGSSLTYDVEIAFDHDRGFYRLHRLY